MAELVRFGVSIEQSLHEMFDKKITKQGYQIVQKLFVI
jgi:metal-responsive CopG/Arc/MetJ family transcriptional regulator